jgi:CubicO group peptidase (beta-lactamase class C family)
MGNGIRGDRQAVAKGANTGGVRRGLVLALCVGAMVALPQLSGCQRDPDPPIAEDASLRIDALLAPLNEGVQPGAAVLVVKDGAIVHSKGYGYAELEARRPIAANTPFRLASVSKHFTAAAIMVLAEDGLLRYDDPVTRWLPGLAAYQGVTIRHLLTHTAGLPDYYDVIDTSAGMPTNADALDQLAAMAEPVFAPGERWEYSNPAYDILPLIVEAASGQGFASFMRERVFAPAGMQQAVIFDETEPEIPGRVYGYEPDGDGFKPNDYDPLNHIIGSGGMYASLEDFYHWDQALHGHEVLSRAALEQAWTPATLNDGESTDYGFGWEIQSRGGHRVVRHGGSWVGFRTHIARWPEDRFTIVVLSNRADFNAEEHVDRIADIWLGNVEP